MTDSSRVDTLVLGYTVGVDRAKGEDYTAIAIYAMNSDDEMEPLWDTIEPGTRRQLLEHVVHWMRKTGAKKVLVMCGTKLLPITRATVEGILRGTITVNDLLI